MTASRPPRRPARLAVLAILVAFLALPGTASAAGNVLTPYRDAVSYDANLTTTTADGRSWAGTETIIMRNASPGPIDRIWLRLWGNGPKGCTPRAVTVTALTGGRKGRLRKDCSALEVLLPAALHPGAHVSLTLTLSITAPQIQDRFGSAEGIMLFGNALPVVAQHDRSGWRLPLYSTYGESFVSSWAHFALTLHHPAALQVAASGSTTTTPDPVGGTATTTSEIDARDMFWAIGPMGEVTVTTPRGTVVHAWSTPEALGDREDAATDASNALQAIERHLPAYPYPEYDVIVARIAAGGGMEYPGIVITDGTDDVTRHETGHQWFYGWVGDDEFREPWIDEGLTSFLEYTWTGLDQPEPTCYRSSELLEKGPTTFATHSMDYWNRHVRQYIVAYDNPVCALRDEQRLLGNAGFTRVMRGIVVDHAQGFLSGVELRRAFRRAGGAASDAIWKRWALAPGG
ncbi:MAG: M1 family aminopeptidase [Patulibacter sp.]|nr:M1 family aminopeptidase [Patulibacter sp.]